MALSPLLFLGCVFVFVVVAIAIILAVSSRFYIERSRIPCEFILNAYNAQIPFDDARLDNGKLAIIRRDSVVAMIHLKPSKIESVRSYFLEMTGIHLKEYAR